MSDLQDWLATLELEHLAQVFEDNQVSLRDLPLLSEDDLKDLGLALGPRKRLLNAVHDLSRSENLRNDVDAQRRELRSPAAERRQLTVLFSDLVGSTTLSGQLDAEDLRELIRAYQNAVVGEITRFEGHVAKFLGDGVMAFFGYPRAHEDDAERAIHAGLAIVDAVARLGVGTSALQVRLGISTGQVVVGDLIGETVSEEAAVTGETPNLAARLQEIATPNSVVIAQGTYELAGRVFECVDLGDHMLKGVVHPTGVWQVGRPRQMQSRFEARSSGLTRFVGREHEVGMLLERWQRVVAGEGQVVLLSGEAGIGKSRILERLREQVSAVPHARINCQCSPHNTNSAFYPIIGHLERAAGFSVDDSGEAKLFKLETALSDTSEDLAQVVPLFAALLSLPLGERYAPVELSPQLQKARTLTALCDQVSALARRQPVLLLFEDLHWIDPTSLEFLERLIEQTAAERVLTIITYRPEFEAPWQRYNHVSELSLNRLSAVQGGEMATHLCGGKALPPDILEQIIEKTDGVPLFVEELIKTVLESDLLTETVDRYELSAPLPPLAIPSTLQDSLMARLDRLGNVRELAQIGAAIGRVFSHRLIRAVANLDDRLLEDGLRQLTESELIFRRGQESEVSYVFKHALVQDTAYESLLRSRRRALHLQIAETLEADFPEAVESEPELLAHHYTLAEKINPAIDNWRKAGEQALRRSANVEAVNHINRGLDLLDNLSEGAERDRQELDLQLALGSAVMAASGQGAPEVGQAYARARELGHRLDDTPRHFRALWGSWRTHFMRSEHALARELGRECLELAEQSGEAAYVLGALFAFGGSQLFVGELSAAQCYLERAIELHDPEEHQALGFLYGHDPGASNLSYMSWLLWYSGYPERSIACGRQGFDMAKASNHWLTIAMVQMYQGINHTFRRDWAAARSTAEAAIDTANARGLPQVVAMAESLHGRSLVEEGDFENGIREIEQGIMERKAMGLRTAQLVEYSFLAEAYAMSGRLDDGLAITTEALNSSETSGECFHLPEIYRVQGDLLLERDPGAAEGCYRQAIAIAGGQGALALELRAATRLAGHWCDQGLRDEAIKLLAPLFGRYSEGFDTPDLKDAEALLSKLA